jgi:hypothetical protein
MAKEHGIIMSAPMVLALLAGRKTVTRRMARQWLKLEVGQGLWVRETFACENLGPDEYPRLVWRADRAARWHSSEKSHSEIFWLQSDYEPKRWTPAIHMPRWASRITLRVTEPPRIERAWDITEADAELEGVTPEHNAFEDSPNRVAFFRIWQQLHTKPGERWSDNPEVVRIAFEKVAT